MQKTSREQRQKDLGSSEMASRKSYPKSFMHVPLALQSKVLLCWTLISESSGASDRKRKAK